MSGGDLLFAAVRALHIGAAMLLVAFPLFALLHERRATGQGDWFCRLVLAVEIVTGAAWFWLATAAMSGGMSWDDLGAVAMQTRFGLLWIGRGVVALLLAFLLAIAGGKSEKRGAANGMMLVLSCVLLGSLAWAGHAGSDARWPEWHLAVDVVHLLAGAMWPVGLVPLAFFLAGRSRGMNEADVAVVRRFSQASFVAVFVLVASGVANSWLMLPSWGALVDSFYGRLLLAKVAFVVVMIALGAVNRYRFLPSLAVAGPPRLARMVAMESGLACAVLLIVGVMGMTPPPS